MKYLITDIKCSIEEFVGKSHKEIDFRDCILQKISKKHRLNTGAISSFRIVKESIDARKKDRILFVYSVMIETDGLLKQCQNIKKVEEVKEELLLGTQKLINRPLIVGSGPSGLFAAYFLAKNGYRPLLIERGENVKKRAQLVNEYWKGGSLDLQTNVQFGEGGAGTFSDGKLTTRISDPQCERVLEIFHRCGAPDEILYKAKPHIGSDNLGRVVENLRNQILSLGGEVRFHTLLTDIILEHGRIKGVKYRDTFFPQVSETVETNVVVLAIGHSSRDTFQMLFDRGIRLEQKPFSVGVRIEHPQELINRAQYGEKYPKELLPSAEYQLYTKVGDRTAYTFCMCPGGLVVASASEEGTIVTNGMSEFLRNGENANSAFVLSVSPLDFGSSHPLAGIDFQRRWEQMSYRAGGNRGAAPVQRLQDFLRGVKSSQYGAIKPTYTGETVLADLNTCLPAYITDGLKGAVDDFNAKLKGFSSGDALLTGVETRTSSPVRIPRMSNFASMDAEGLYPAGEGAGYAGGIMSAAVDGLKVASAIIAKYSKPE